MRACAYVCDVICACELRHECSDDTTTIMCRQSILQRRRHVLGDVIDNDEHTKAAALCAVSERDDIECDVDIGGIV